MNDIFEEAREDLAKAINGLERVSEGFHAVKMRVKESENKEYGQRERIEEYRFDENMVERLQRGLDAITRIIMAPRSDYAQERELSEAFRAKKPSQEAITHLASHSRYIHHVEGDRVIPEKLLTLFSETEEKIYENRFIKSLLERLALFLGKRMHYWESLGEAKRRDVFRLKGTVELSGIAYQVDTRIEASSSANEGVFAEKNKEILQKVSAMKERVIALGKSEFIQAMRASPAVTSPIKTTNLLLNHPDYREAKDLWDYIESEQSLGVAIDVKDTNQEFDGHSADMAENLLAYSVLLHNGHLVRDRAIPSEGVSLKTFFPKIILPLEDEAFENGRYVYTHLPQASLKAENLLEEVVEAKEAIHADVKQAKEEQFLKLTCERLAVFEAEVLENETYPSCSGSVS